MNASGADSHIGDLCWVEADATGTDSWWGVHAADKPDLYGGPGYIGNRSMVLYEKGDDLGFDGTFASEWWGTSCEPIACCNVRQYAVVD